MSTTDWAAGYDAAVWHADGGEDELDDTTGYCDTCDGMSTFAPDQNDDNGLLVCVWDGTLMDGAADWT